jgi:hypothetical protein
MKWFEVDAGWMLIRSLAAVGLASDIYVRNKRWKPSERIVDLGDLADAQLADEHAVDPTTTP